MYRKVKHGGAVLTNEAEKLTGLTMSMPFMMCLRGALKLSGRGSYTPLTIALKSPA